MAATLRWRGACKKSASQDATTILYHSHARLYVLSTLWDIPFLLSLATITLRDHFNELSWSRIDLAQTVEHNAKRL
jgi:hypothetical protein